MARIYLSPLIVDIRNKQSDTVFSKWKGINYIRSRVVPHNPKSSAQVAIRDALKRLVLLWQNCFASVKINWDDWTSGRDYSGFNKFIGKNVIDERDGNLLDIMQEVGFTTLSTWVPATGTLTKEIDVAFTPDPVPAGTDLEIHVKEVGASPWDFTALYPATTASPVTLTLPKATTLYEVYGYLVKDTAPGVGDTGNDRSNTATSQT